LQGIVPDEDWDALIETLAEALPTTFRITGFRK
jgi:hypothetical protein